MIIGAEGSPFRDKMVGVLGYFKGSERVGPGVWAGCYYETRRLSSIALESRNRLSLLLDIINLIVVHTGRYISYLLIRQSPMLPVFLSDSDSRER